MFPVNWDAFQKYPIRVRTTGAPARGFGAVIAYGHFPRSELPVDCSEHGDTLFLQMDQFTRLDVGEAHKGGGRRRRPVYVPDDQLPFHGRREDLC